MISVNRRWLLPLVLLVACNGEPPPADPSSSVSQKPVGPVVTAAPAVSTSAAPAASASAAPAFAASDAGANIDLEEQLRALGGSGTPGDSHPTLHIGRGPQEVFPVDASAPEPPKEIPFAFSMGGVAMSVPVAGAETTMRSLMGPARSCFKRGLRKNPDQQGRVSLSLTVGDSGEVSNVSVSAAGVDAAVAQCIAGAARRLRFQEVDGGVATLRTAFNFVKQ